MLYIAPLALFVNTGQRCCSCAAAVADANTTQLLDTFLGFTPVERPNKINSNEITPRSAVKFVAPPIYANGLLMTT